MDYPEKIVIVVGLPRSGSTLVTRILNLHPDIFISPETHYFFKIWAKRKLLGNLEERKNFDKLRSYIKELPILDPHWRQCNLSIEKIRRYFIEYNSIKESYARLFLALLKSISNEKMIVGEKTPLHSYFLDEIYNLFNSLDLKIIFVQRDVRAVVASTLKSGWSGDPNHLKPVFRWKRCIRMLENFKLTTKKSEIIWVARYEDIVKSPLKTVKEMCGFLGVDFCEQMFNITYINTSFSKNRQAKGIETGSIDRWQTFLNEVQIKEIEQLCKDEMVRYGYSLAQENNSLGIIRKMFLKSYNILEDQKNKLFKLTSFLGVYND